MDRKACVCSHALADVSTGITVATSFPLLGEGHNLLRGQLQVLIMSSVTANKVTEDPIPPKSNFSTKNSSFVGQKIKTD